MRTLRLQRRRPRGDEGVTLAELLVSIGLMAVLGTLLVTLSVAVQRTSRSADLSAQQVADVRAAYERVASVMRVAVVLNDGDTTPFLTASGNDAVFFANLRTVNLSAANASTSVSGPTKVEYVAVPGATGTACKATEQCLVERLTSTSWSSGAGGTYAWRASGTTTSRVLLHGLSPSATLFSFNGSASSATAAPLPVGSTGLAPADLSKVRAVSITITPADAYGVSLPTATASGRVTLVGTSHAATVPGDLS
ncbi:hypothetical protein EV189_1181 [Motilibacter rhizosphaerae]|uniref:Prepilin-type N-terminal cleavage/methylation domain-containing protein n=1 Tax=Motilibacter rhizosphaerae TaxID=598652 RepID=A0A4Q7NRM6_9ACTN|nr:hypothetical protein [Motilibacter rhizosphaerae]RZS89418.1 hypothetical protein EV189_1181 [Motilibacter rhizosphaerae]